MDFQNKKIKYLNLDVNSLPIDAILVDADPDLGFTIINSHNKYDYLYCYLGDSSPQIQKRIKRKGQIAEGMDAKAWDYLCKIMKEKDPIFCVQDFDAITGDDGELGISNAAENCVFRQ